MYQVKFIDIIFQLFDQQNEYASKEQINYAFN